MMKKLVFMLQAMLGLYLLGAFVSGVSKAERKIRKIISFVWKMQINAVNEQNNKSNAQKIF